LAVDLAVVKALPTISVRFLDILYLKRYSVPYEVRY
jgi:hypothetical protein